MSQHAYNFIVTMLNVLAIAILVGVAWPAIANRRCSTRRMLAIVTAACLAAASAVWAARR